MNKLLQIWERTIAEPMRRVDDEARDYLASDGSRGLDRKVISVLVTVAVCLTLQHYFVTREDAGRRILGLMSFFGWTSLGERLARLADSKVEIERLSFWSAGCIVTYLMPLLVIRLIFRERIRDYGLKLTGVFAGLRIYLFFLGIVLPLVVLVSTDAHFQETYPFYTLLSEEPLWPRFWQWELLYALQFIALEFFFRGFLLHGVRKRFGWYSIFVMMVPYCMIHFQKPLPEAWASIVAGIALGFMSLKTRSIWMGAALHVTVAISMDMVSLWRKGLLAN